MTTLLETQRFNITVISRSDSEATFPSGVTLKKGDYSSDEFFESAFAGQDVAVFILKFVVTPDQQLRMIEAAARAGVRWIIPTEFAGDGNNKAMVESVPLFQPKAAVRRGIEELAKTYNGLSWIGICTGPWTDFSLPKPVLFGIDAKARSATIYTGSGRFNTSTISQVARAFAGLLGLPIHAEAGKPSLSSFVNDFVYVSSFYITQKELLYAVQRATGTTSSDWTINGKSIDEWTAENKSAVAAGQLMGMAGLTYGAYMGEGRGGDVNDKLANEVLGLPKEDLEEAVRKALV